MQVMTFIFAIALVVSLTIAFWFNTKAGQRWIDNL